MHHKVVSSDKFVSIFRLSVTCGLARNVGLKFVLNFEWKISVYTEYIQNIYRFSDETSYTFS